MSQEQAIPQEQAPDQEEVAQKEAPQETAQQEATRARLRELDAQLQAQEQAQQAAPVPQDTGDLIGHPDVPDPDPQEVTDPSDLSYVEPDPDATEPQE